MACISLLFKTSVLFCAVVHTFSVEHSLFYTYTALSKPLNLPGIHEFTAVGILDNRELDYYNSKAQVKTPKQTWMKEKMQDDYWEKGTQSRKSKEQWFKVNVEILMDRMRHNKSDLHVLQWRHGCVVDGENGNSKFVKGIDEYSYDGVEFLSFDEKQSRWIAPVQAAEPTKRKWDGVDILNQYTKSYLEKECVDWLTKFMDYGQEELKKHSPPDVHLFAKKSIKDPKGLLLTCMATGFYPPDMQMHIRKSKTSIPEHMLTSSGVRPNGDDTYQLRKSLEILEDEKPLYDCQVFHSALKEPVTVSPGEDIRCLDCTGPKVWSGLFGLVIGAVLTLVLIAGIIIFLIKTGKIALLRNGGSRTINTNSVPLTAPAPALASATETAISMPDTKGCDNSSDSGKGSDESTQSSQDNINEESRLLSSNQHSDSALGSSSGESRQSSDYAAQNQIIR